MFNDRYVEITLEDYHDIAMGLFKASGCDDETAKVLTEHHMDSDLRGVGVQGMNHLVFDHIPHMLMGRVKPAKKPSVVKESTSYVLIDGNRGPGAIAAYLAVEMAAKKAKESGICMVGIRNSNDFFRAGRYVEMLAEKGFIGLVFSDDQWPGVHPLGGTAPVIGLNPMAIAVPSDTIPFVIDFTPCATVTSWVRSSRNYGDRLPEGCAIDKDGRPTTDATKISNGTDYSEDLGAISPLGANNSDRRGKAVGYGLLLAIDFLAGALTGSDMGVAHQRKFPRNVKGHFLIAIDPGAFGNPRVFIKAVRTRMDEIKNSRKAQGSSEIRIPGERSYAAREKALAENKVKIDLFLWEDVKKLCDKLKVAVPKPIFPQNK